MTSRLFKVPLVLEWLLESRLHGNTPADCYTQMVPLHADSFELMFMQSAMQEVWDLR